MKVEQFEIKYGNKGGFAKLINLRTLCYSRNYIAQYFGVSNDAVRQWGWMFFEMPELDGYEKEFDREKVITEMLIFAGSHELKDFRFAFKGNPVYKEVLERVKKENYGI